MGASFGRGGATQYVQDFANSDLIIIQGSNTAEAHPVAFQYLTEARLKGTRVIHIDPRFTRTTANSDQHVPIRVGSDVVLLGALINHVLSNELYFKEYVEAFTNASTIIGPDYRDAEDLDGIFSGYDPETATYDRSSWQYEKDEHGKPRTDPSLKHPRAVINILKRHYARYTPEMVTRLCGISAEDFQSVADQVVANSNRERTTCWVYAVGWTQHTLGVQFIRTAAILQLLMGNVGRPGGGIMAMRGHASIQGASDIPTLFNLLPGYLPMPMAGKEDTFQQYLDAVRDPGQIGYWGDAENYVVSLLKAWWGDAATAENDWAYDYLPRLTGSHGTYQSVMNMIDGITDGYFVLGQNPAIGSAHGRLQREGLAALKWLVVRDFNMIETASFWKDGPELATGEMDTEKIGTEVFFMPAANHTEKAGSFTQTHRMVQWREQAVHPPGDAQSELQFFYNLGLKIRERLADSTDPRDRPLLDLTWDYPVDEHGDPDAEAVLAEINGRYVSGPDAGKPLSSFTEMKADGSTIGGCWIYTGVYADGINQAARRTPGNQQPAWAPDWGWAWPLNRRILYNRASADPQGKPWSERKKLIWWDADEGKWVGNDVPDFPLTLAPDARPDPDASGPAGLSGIDPFIMQPDGKGWLFAPKGVIDAPIPTHYEAQESPVKNPLYRQQANPTRMVYPRKDNLWAPSGDSPGSDVYPCVATTYRLTEHHTAGGMSRWLPYLSELQPEFFCEISPELAADRGLENGGWATIISARSAVEARVLVTERMTPLLIEGQTIHQIGLPYHWGVGSDAIVTGDSANDLIGVALDPNVEIQESKVFSVEIIPGRRPQGPDLLRLVAEYQSRAGSTVETDNVRWDGEGLDNRMAESGAVDPLPDVQSGPAEPSGSPGSTDTAHPSDPKDGDS